MNTEGLYQLFLSNPTISTDTRKIIPGSIFFALKGSRFDGNDYAAKALNSGAAYAVVDNPDVVKGNNFILVNDVLDSLQRLASYHRKKLGLPVIAITGTNGKTTTKELISVVLSKKYRVCATKGNLNNHIGVPLTLLEMTDKTELAIIEMGANHPGEIETLCQITDPDFGLITNIGKAHLEGFGSFEGVKNTKAELYIYLKKKNGKIFINNENPILKSIAPENLDRFSYGTESGAYLRGEIINQTPFLNIRAWFTKGLLYIKSKLIGRYNFENILAAACIGNFFDVDPLIIQEAIENYLPYNNRSQLIGKGTNKVIMDAYNANPTSMNASIKNFIELPGKNKILILGDMLELGDKANIEHQEIVNLIQANTFEKVFLVGYYFKNSNTQAPIKKFEDTNTLIEYLKINPIINSMVLIKGSRGIRLEKVLDFF